MSDEQSAEIEFEGGVPLSERGFHIITFDCYGTLIDWRSGIIAAFQSQAEREGLVLDPDAILKAYAEEERAVESEGYRLYREVLGETAHRVAGRLGLTVPSASYAFLADSLADWKPFDDTNSALERLARKFQLGLLSNIDDDLLALTRRHLTVPFDLIVTAQQVKSYKPGLAHFNEGLSRAGSRLLLHAAQSYVHDIKPASAIGLPVVWINRHGESPDKDGPFPSETVKDVAGLAALMGM